MSEKSTVEIQLSEEAQQLFDAYQRYTNTTPEAYIDALVVKTLPTLRAMVEAFDEAEEPEAVMELFGKKMAAEMLRQKEAAQQGVVSS
ncbi:hypothetical protein [Motiliproteus sp. MSK22-1]|uniref:hypothetical protein n=1 Tax=Motiliproteus sp. MSK22-1 TaxID=1897630 RepID=UPI0009758D11|nr:hypothetical protein [Motiliproteus sp. MSK22-1]OMH31750.1 hypothetical protein BGP75_16655 [Motiliproteus sp. MSK22-1]